MDNQPDLELDRRLSALLEQTRKEPVSPRLRALADRLSLALDEAQQRRNAQDAAGK